jgi:hypothetical protein
MNQLRYGTLDKVMQTGDLKKQAERDDDLRFTVGRALQSLQPAITAAPRDAGLQEVLNSFLRALSTYNASVDESPAAAARVFARELDRLIQERQLGQAMKSSLSKGYAPGDFWRR